MRAISTVTSLRLHAFLSVFVTGFLTSGTVLPAIAQIASDGTTNTTINANGSNFTIINGIEKGNNLFHSFSNFSVPTGGSATFDLVNTPNINTIFSRITGGNISNIDGLIQTVNSSNAVSLFLMNPAGILFGQNAKLNIGGSFVGTTANSINFADGVEFSAIDASKTSLLTMTVPIGLQMGNNPGQIAIKGSGHNLIAKDASFSPYINPGSVNSLQVKPGKSLALIGGDIKLDGAVISSESGRVDLVGVRKGEVNLIQTLKGFGLDDVTSDLGNIQLSQLALVDVSGAGTGSIKIQGNQITVKDGSVVMMQNRGIQPVGDININAKSIELSGSIANSNIRTSIMSETLAGNSGNINIKTERLKVENGAGLFSRTFGFGSSGSIDINAAESINIIGVSATNPNLFSSIGSATFSQGNSGNIHLSTQNLSILNGGVIIATASSTGSVGSININSKTTQVASSIAGIPAGTAIAASTYGKGDAGKIIINTQTLSIQGDANVNTASFNSGNSGSVTVNATEWVKLDATDALAAPRISSSVIPEVTSLGKLLRLPKVPTGNAGNVTINTPYLKVSNGDISVFNEGTGNAGTLKVNADLVQLENVGSLVARSNSGEGGNILVEADSLKLVNNSLITTNASGGGNGGNVTINLRDSLVMRRSSQIDTESLSKGNGGNITINSPVIVGLENSDIIANSVRGNGGNIDVTTQGIFGLKYRNRLTSENDITASSEFGVNGTVDINNFGVDPNSGLVELPVNLVDSSKLITTGCSNNTDSSFVATGRGGIPENPNQQVRSDVYDGLGLRTWSDIRDLSVYRHGEITAKIPPSPETLIQATSWHRNTQGKVELVAQKAVTQVQPSLTCAAVPR